MQRPPTSNAITIDDFYQRPTDIRQLALQMPFVQLPTFPGLFQSDHNIVSSSVVARLGELVGCPIEFENYRRTFGVFRAAMDEAARALNIHCDLHDWSAVIHLSTPPAGVKSGTGLFRHRETGLLGPPRGETAESDLIKRLVADAADMRAWEMYDFLEGAFNRLVIFRGRDCFHESIGRYGNELSNARLTQNFFFSSSAP